MFESIDSESIEKIVSASVHYIDTNDMLSSPRKVVRKWNGTQENLLSLMHINKNHLTDDVCEMLSILAQPTVFDALECGQQDVDGLIIEENTRPVLHLQRDEKEALKITTHTIAIDMEDIRSCVELVKHTREKTNRRWWKLTGLSTVIGAGLALWWSRK